MIRTVSVSLTILIINICLTSCHPIVKTESNSSDNRSQTIANDDQMQNIDTSVFESRTLSLYMLDQYWKAKGKMKVAFLKFCIFKLKILIQLVSVIFGLRPEDANPMPYGRPRPMQYGGPNEASAMSMPVPSYANQWQWQHNQRYDYGYDYDFQFQLMPQDFMVKSGQTFSSIYTWIYNTFSNIFNYFI